MKVNRDPVIVYKLMKIKFEEIKKAEKVLIQVEKAAWSEYEKCHREGTRSWRNTRTWLKQLGQKEWDLQKSKNRNKIEWLKIKYSPVEKTKRTSTDEN